MKAFVSSPDLETFLSRFGAVPNEKFVVKLIREKRHPLVTDILNGSWWI